MSILKDKVIVVLGASSGIGAWISKYFAENGAKVCICARRKELLKNLTNEMNQAGYNMIYRVCDATDNAEVFKIATDVIDIYEKVDVWINCAGQNKAIGKVYELTADEIWEEITIDLRSSINGVHSALQKRINQNHGIIVNFCGGGAAYPHFV